MANKTEMVAELKALGVEADETSTAAVLKELLVTARAAADAEDGEGADAAAVEGEGAEAEAPALTEDERLRSEPTPEEVLTTVGLDAGDGSYTYVKVKEEDAKLRRLLLNGRNYEHVHDDGFGRWLYRNM